LMCPFSRQSHMNKKLCNERKYSDIQNHRTICMCTSTSINTHHATPAPSHKHDPPPTYLPQLRQHEARPEVAEVPRLHFPQLPLDRHPLLEARVDEEVGAELWRG
jgi:hypothetical protein